MSSFLVTRNAVSIGLGGIPSLRSGTGGLNPSLDLNFAVSKSLDPRITFTRASTATYFDANGVMQTAASGVPRIDYDPVTLACKGLLIEEQRTNLLTYSEQFDNAAWDKAALPVSVTANATTAPSGDIAADLVIPTTSNATHGVRQSFSSTATSSVMSAYVKAAGYNRVQLYMSNGGGFGYVTFDLAAVTVTHTVNGTVTGVSGTISSVGNGWLRITMFGSGSTAIVLGGILILDAAGNGSSLGPAFAGDGTSGIYIWGAQVEVGAFPTSYIPTTTAQVTRAADFASMTGANFSSWYRADEGTVVVESTPQTGSYLYVDAHSSSTVDVVRTVHAPTSAHLSTLVAGTPTSSFNITGLSAPIKSAFAYKLNNFAASANGGAAQTDASGNVPTGVNRLTIGQNNYSPTGHGGHIKRIAFYPQRLTNTELQALTA